jgi:uncharacterized protein YndB with AHSA1/START domain
MKTLLSFLLVLVSFSCKEHHDTATHENRPDSSLAATLDEPIADSVFDRSAVTKDGQKLLRYEIVFNKPLSAVWDAFTVESRIITWMAPKVKLDLRTGGSIQTMTPGFPDVLLNIPTLIPNELLVYKVNLNSAFSSKVQTEGGSLQEIIQFTSLGANKSKITATMTGWGKGDEWNKIYSFFQSNNKMTYKDLITSVNKGS